jgi:hypothetical protein
VGVSILIPRLQLKLICHNLSQEGCFFKTADLGPVGTTLSLLVDPPEIGLILVEGRITHKGEDGKGAGIEFVSIEPEDRLKLAYFLDIFQ